MSNPVAYGAPAPVAPARVSWGGVALRRHVLAYAGLGAAVGVAVYVLLLGGAQLRLPGGFPRPPVSAFLRGSLLVAAVQTAAAVPLWWLRSRSRR